MERDPASVSERGARPFRSSLLIALLLFAGAVRAPAEVHWGENHPDARWKRIESPHFRVIYPERSAATAARALAIAEERYKPITELVGGAPPGRIDIVITDWADRSGGLSYSTWPRIEIAAYPLDRRPESVDFLSQVIAHEFTHIAFYYAVGGVRLQPVAAPLALLNIPDWWVEGLPSAVEKPRAAPREQDWVDVLAATGGLPRLRRLDTIHQGDRLDGLLVYWVGESKMRWFVERFGRGKVAEVHQAMRPIPYSFDRALRRVVGAGEDSLHAMWLGDLTRFARPVPDRSEIDAVPLPPSIERPLSFAFSSQGDLAVVAVPDEDVWWPELYVRRWWEEAFRLVEPEPVGTDIAWSPSGRELAYARQSTGPSGEPRYDLFVYQSCSGTTRRITRGVRAIAPVWQEHSTYTALFAIGYDETTGASTLLAVDPRGGVRHSFPPPPEVLLFDDLAARKGETILSGLTVEGQRDLYAFGYRPKKGEGSFRRITEDQEAEYDPFLNDEREILFSAYREGRWVLARARYGRERGKEVVAGGPSYLRHAAPGRSGAPHGVSISGRYGGFISPLLHPAWPDEGGAEPPWHHVAALGPAPSHAAPPLPAAGPYRSWLEVRPRPEISVPHLGTDEVRVLVDDLLADPANRHRFSLEGAFRYDGEERWIAGTYQNRLLLPTLYLRGLIDVDRGGAGGEEEIEGRGAAASLYLPFSGSSISTGYSATLTLSHLREEGRGGSAFHRRETSLSTRLARRVARPRHQTFLSLRHEKGIDLWNPSLLPERVEVEGAASRAFYRNDAFFSLSALGAREIGGEKRSLAVYPANIVSPVGKAEGETVLRWGAGVSYPWSEDLGWSGGPFHLERLTHRISYREGWAWDPGPADPVRSITSELDLTLFSGFVLPFFGTATTHFRLGAARELHEDAATEIYFAIDSDYWNQRWAGDELRYEARRYPRRQGRGLGGLESPGTLLPAKAWRTEACR